MIDLHTHLIWDIDDGSLSKEMTINMLRQAYEGGTKHLVLTPHYFPGYFQAPKRVVKEKCEEIKALAKEENIKLEIYCGQEVYYNDKILDQYEDEIIGTINDSDYMLIELNMREFSKDEVLDKIYELQLQGVKPIIAHPERYKIFLKKPWLINEFIEEGYLFQLNSGSLTGYFGKDVKRLAETFLKNRIYSFVGSDAHRDEKRNPNMFEIIELLEEMDKQYFEYIRESSKKVLQNEEVEFIGKLIKEKKGLFSFLKSK